MSILRHFNKHHGYAPDGKRTPAKGGGGGFMGVITAVVGAALMFVPGMQAVGASLIVSGLMTVATSVLTKSPAAQQGGFGPDQGSQSDPGVKSTLPLDTANKIPVIYGNAFVKGINVWRDVSADDKTAYYCVAFSEVPDSVSTNTMNQAYYNDCRVTLDGSGWVTHAVDSSGNVVVDYNNNIRIQYFGNGMPTDRNVFDNISWLRDPNNKMTDLSFAIITVKYNASKQIYTLGAIQVNISNTLSDPGLALADYMANARYGANLKTHFIDYDKLNELSAYSAEQLPVVYQGSTIYRPRYQINGVVNTNQNAFTNIQQLVASVGSQLSYDIQNGKFSLYIDRAADPVFDFDSSTILGTLSITTQELSSTPTAVQGSYPQGMLGNGEIDGIYKGGQNTVLEELNPSQYPVTSPINQTNLSYQFVNNNVQAKRLVDLELNQNKLDLTVQFVSTHHATGLSAGQVITITSETDGWTLKKFRVLAVTENEDQSGQITINVTAKEYADAIYTDLTVLAYDPAPNTDLPNPRALANYTPLAPTAQAAVNEAILSFTIPATVIVEKVDVYTRAAGTASEYTWLQAILPTATDGLFTDGVNSQVLTIAGGSYDIKVIYSNSLTISNFSPPLLDFNWAPATSVKTAYAINPPIVLVPASSDGGNAVVGETVQTTLTFDGIPVPVWDGSGSWPVGTWYTGNISATNGYTTTSAVGNTTTSTVDFTLTGADLGYNTSTVTLADNQYKLDSGGNVLILPDVYVPISKVLSGSSSGTRGPLPLAYVETTSNPTVYSNTQFTTAFQASRIAQSGNIGTGVTPINGDTAQFIYVNGINNPSIVVSYLDGGWVPAVGNIMSGDLIVQNTIRSNALYTNDVYTIDLSSTNANVGNLDSLGYWLQANTGNARFAGNVSIGANANIGNNLTIGNDANVGNNLTIGNNLIIGNDANVGNNLSIGNNLIIGTGGAIGGNLTIGNDATIGNNLIVGANAIIGDGATIGNIINSGELAPSSVGTTQIRGGSITTDKISVDYVYAGNINADQISTGTLNSNIIYAGQIAVGQIAAGTLNGNVIYAGSINANQVSAGTLTGNVVYSGDIISKGANNGEFTGNGYWMDYVSGQAYFGGIVIVGGSLETKSTFYANGGITANGFFQGQGAHFYGPVTITYPGSEALNIAGNTTINGSLSVTGGLSQQNLSVTGTLATNRLNAEYSTIANTLEVDGPLVSASLTNQINSAITAANISQSMLSNGFNLSAPQTVFTGGSSGVYYTVGNSFIFTNNLQKYNAFAWGSETLSNLSWQSNGVGNIVVTGTVYATDSYRTQTILSSSQISIPYTNTGINTTVTWTSPNTLPQFNFNGLFDQTPTQAYTTTYRMAVSWQKSGTGTVQNVSGTISQGTLSMLLLKPN